MKFPCYLYSGTSGFILVHWKIVNNKSQLLILALLVFHILHIWDTRHQYECARTPPEVSNFKRKKLLRSRFQQVFEQQSGEEQVEQTSLQRFAFHARK
jgi:hypothetical protein